MKINKPENPPLVLVKPYNEDTLDLCSYNCQTEEYENAENSYPVKDIEYYVFVQDVLKMISN